MLYLVAILGISCVYAQQSAWCAWNRAIKPVNEDNADTYNWINGEYFRIETFSSGGQTALWHGMPYYEMTNDGACYSEKNYLYRYINSQVYPPTFTWVIAASIGTLPINGYAYCGPDETPSITDLSSPDMCNGKWKVGQPEDATRGQAAAQATDIFFTVTPGGCPQITCNQLRYCSVNNEIWSWPNGVKNTDGESGASCETYSYHSPNTYSVSNTASNTNTFYLFWFRSTWSWAVSESITGTYNKDDCENYKYGKGFTAVSNVIPGDPNDPTVKTPWYQIGGEMTDGGTPDYWDWVDSLSTANRVIECIGSITTPSPLATPAPLTTKAPAGVDLCEDYDSNNGAQIPAEWGCGTPSPITSINTPKPTPSPIPTDAPTTPYPTQTPAPVAIPATPPAKVGTLPPTRSNSPTTAAQNGSPRPTFPTLSPAFNAPVYIPARPPNHPAGNPAKYGTKSPAYQNNGSGSNAASINCNRAYLLCIVMALYKLLF
mmetsp:Transcript_26542/g.23354  ORF Transcript_26542/g.23354 Transcript_26542/m.23354 type:complete len:488 (+) Transcript_26542:48-1511(+)